MRQECPVGGDEDIRKNEEPRKLVVLKNLAGMFLEENVFLLIQIECDAETVAMVGMSQIPSEPKLLVLPESVKTQKRKRSNE